MSEILEQLQKAFGEPLLRDEVGLSAVTIVELMHGVSRAALEAQRRRRLAFDQDLRVAIMVHPLTDEIAGRRESSPGVRPSVASLCHSPTC